MTENRKVQKYKQIIKFLIVIINYEHFYKDHFIIVAYHQYDVLATKMILEWCTINFCKIDFKKFQFFTPHYPTTKIPLKFLFLNLFFLNLAKTSSCLKLVWLCWTLKQSISCLHFISFGGRVILSADI